MRVSLNSEYGMLICTITHIIMININMYVTSRHIGAAWARVALSAVSHPRGSCAKLYPLFPLF